MLVADEDQMEKKGGVRVVVLMKRVAIGRTAGGVEQAVGVRGRQEWCKHRMSREQLAGITGQRVQADGGKEVLVEGNEVWEEWTGQAVEDTEWRRKIKGQWRAKEQAVVRRGGVGKWSKTRTRWTETRCTTEVEQGRRHGRRGALAAPCYVWSHFYYPLLLVN